MYVATIITTGEFSSNAVQCLDEKHTQHDIVEAGTVSEIFIINMFLLDL